ncbi:MAG: hypothetical protein R6V04_07395 [bacterium]
MRIVYTINIVILIVFKLVSQTIPEGKNTLIYQNQNKDFFENIIFADSVIFYDPGAMGDNTGDEPHKQYQNPKNALGAPDCITDNDIGFVSLGNGGTLILKFTDNIPINGPGADLAVFEVGNDEPINVWISHDNKTYLPLEKTPDSNYKFNFISEPETSYSYKFVKIRDIYDYTVSTDSSDLATGADIDAVAALNTVKRMVFKTDSLFSSNTIYLSEWGRKRLSALADKIEHLSQPILSINAYSHQKANEQYLSMSTYMQADIIYQYLYNTEELTHAEYHIAGKGYNANIQYSIIEILIKPKITETD